MTTNIGKLDQLIVFQSLVETNVGGELTQAWSADSPPDQEWAAVKTQRGSEAFESARINAREIIRVCLRYREDVTNQWRFIWEGQIYNVTVTDRSMRRKGQLWLTAECVGAL